MGERTVLITGSSRGIGKAIALRCARDGYNVVLHCRTRVGEAGQVADELRGSGCSVRVLMFDIADRAAAATALEDDISTHGCYYGVVCNAGIARDATFAGMTGGEWDSVLRTNLDGFFNVLNPLIMPMVRTRKPGRIVTISSVSGLIGNRGQVNYSASKAGIIGATRALAVELASRQITVNCVAPGLIDTEMVDESIKVEALKLIPAGRIGTGGEVAAAVSFLLRDEAAYVTRQVLSVNGGLTP
jgi:3-oxoacyl-[acyl-carrier protein] reductase